MSDCTEAFKRFHTSISLTKTELRALRAARSAVSKKVREYFRDIKNFKISFKGQGSFSMGTIIRPLNGDFDIDIGLYLDGYSWLKHELPKPETISQWLMNALINHTSTPPINKRNCVRLRYKPPVAGRSVAYHVDIPIYVRYPNLLDQMVTRIGVTGPQQWSKKSDPVGFTAWFFKQCKVNSKDVNQLVRLVKYIKAWKEHVKGDSKFPSGMALTILMAKYFKPSDRDDVAFAQTVRNAYSEVFWFLGSEEICSPVAPYNNLLEKLNENQHRSFKLALKSLKQNLIDAVESTDANKAMEIWQNCFGARFK